MRYTRNMTRELPERLADVADSDETDIRRLAERMLEHMDGGEGGA